MNQGKLPKLEEMTDILDIRNPAFWDLRWVGALLASILLVLLVYLACLGWRWWKRRKTNLETTTTPLERGLARLDALIPEKYIEPGRIREFYFSLSEIFRDFLEEELEVHAKEATVEEIKPRLRSIPELHSNEGNEAIHLLEMADLAKFAKWVPPQEKIFQNYRMCRGWMTKIAERRKKIAEAELQPQKVSG
jgi:hypothetical protein